MSVVKLLLKHNADVSLLDIKGRTAKEVAKTPEIAALFP